MSITATALQAAAAVTPDNSVQTPAPAPASTDAIANKQTFLQLLIAQIKNQDPLQPTDGVQFLSQLAQFSQVEQLVAIHQGIDTLNQTKQNTPAQASNGATAPTNGSQS